MSQKYKTLIEQFENGTMKESDFHHKEHLVMCLWYMSQHSELEGTLRMKHGIMKYNLIYSVPQSDQRGYHETITMFFIQLAQKFLKAVDSNLSFDQKVELFLEQNPELWTTLNRHYTKPYLWSSFARRFWANPDLELL